MTPKPEGPKPVAAVVTEWRTNSHADVILGRLLEPEKWGHERPFGLKLASIYADQFPPGDRCRTLCEKHGVPVFPTVAGAVGVGTRGVPVEGVILIGEHGQYAINPRGQRFYPRRRLFDDVVHAFRVFGRRVPVFSDKHLSYDWLFARWMYDLARHEGIPFMAGSSLPVSIRNPELDLPLGCELDEVFALGYHDFDAYGFHTLEMLQCMVERRKGGETGVASVRCVSGPEVWEKERWPKGLLDALAPARKALNPHAPPTVARLPTDKLFQIRYRDGLEAFAGLFDSVGECFGFACRRRGADRPDATVFDVQNMHPFSHFGYLVRAIEQMIATGRPAYPVERTLLTTGILAALFQSHAEGGSVIPTPHLAEVAYAPADWPHARGPRWTPA